MDDQIRKQVKFVFIFGLHHSVFLVIESPKQDDQNQVMESKQNVFRGSHQFWMMSDEFWIRSLKTHCIQTTPKFLKPFSSPKSSKKAFRKLVKEKENLVDVRIVTWVQILYLG